MKKLLEKYQNHKAKKAAKKVELLKTIEKNRARYQKLMDKTPEERMAELKAHQEAVNAELKERAEKGEISLENRACGHVNYTVIRLDRKKDDLEVAAIVGKTATKVAIGGVLAAGSVIKASKDLKANTQHYTAQCNDCHKIFKIEL